MNKNLLLVALVLVLALTLSACGSDPSGSAESMSAISTEQVIAYEEISTQSSPLPAPTQTEEYNCPPQGQFALTAGLVPVNTVEALLVEIVLCDGGMQVHDNIPNSVALDLMFFPGIGGRRSYIGTQPFETVSGLEITAEAGLFGSFVNESQITNLICIVNDIDTNVQAVQFACTAAS